MKFLKYILAYALFLSSCAGEENNESTSAVSAVEDAPGTVTITKEQLETIDLQLSTMKLNNISSTIKANGYLDVPPQNKAVISPMITGYVRKVNFLVGDVVKKGQVVAELESMEFVDLQQQYLEVKSQLSYLIDDYDRQKLLRDQDAVSRKKYLQAEADYRRAESLQNSLKAKLRMLGTNLNQLDEGDIQQIVYMHTPISGSIKTLNMVIGRHVDPSEEIYEIVNTDHLHLELKVYERDITKVRKGQKVLFIIPSISEHPFEGEVFLVGEDLTEDKRSINVHVHVNEEDGPFIVGMYANATIATSGNESHTLPQTAIVVDDNREFVFRQISSGDGSMRFEKVPVLTGVEAEGLVELTNYENLSKDDQIVTKGAFYLLNAFAIGEN
jgi:cobalt-zinc-cadmium efflux system membrane fusion protein